MKVCKQRLVHPTVILTLFAFTAAGRVIADEGTPGFPAPVVAALSRIDEIYVATARKDGSRSKPAPVWFAFVDGAIWFATSPDSHKAGRVGKGSPIFLSVDGKKGPFIETRAEIVNDGAMADRLGRIYADKYWIAWLGLFRPSRARLEAGKIVLLKLTAMQ
jgi:hypothetical protein